MDATEIPIDGELDLHYFQPRDVKDVVGEYIYACREAGIYQIRIVHGKGKGVLRRIVHSFLADHPDVIRYWHESGAGSWGATLAELRK